MRRIFVAIIAMATISLTWAQYDIFTQKGEKINLDSLVTLLSNYDVVFFGEKHDDPVAHKLELEIFKKLSKKWGKIALSLEMLEADAQPVVDSYISGKISEKEFKEKVNLWPNYDSDYRPLVEFAKSNGIHVIAANIPRRLANMVAKGGIKAWNSLNNEDLSLIPRMTYFFNDKYRELFEATMKNNPMMKHMKNVSIENLYHAQCVKDEKMAESISDFLREHPDYHVFMCNGSFHSDYHLGIVQKLLIRNPNLRVATISAIPVPKLAKINPKAYLDRADFVILTFHGKNKKDSEGSK